MSDVFISYSRKDGDFVRRLHAALAAQGREAWVDWEDIPPTARWWAEICAGIEASDTFVFVITPDSVRSKPCFDEIDHAAKHNKRIIPILHREITEEPDQQRIHPAINAHNWIFFRDEDVFDAALDILLTAIDADLDHVHIHTRLLVRAKEWETSGRDRSFLLHGSDLAEAEIWLISASEKDPKPTEQQTTYIFASRRAANRRQRILLIGVSTALIITVVLGVLSFVLFGQSQNNLQLAQARGTESEQNAVEAQLQSTAAISAAATSERQAAESQSFALSIAAQQAMDAGNTDLAIALAVEANKIPNPSFESQRTLMDAAYAPGIVRDIDVFMGHIHVGIMPAGRFVFGYLGAVGSDKRMVQLWDTEKGESVKQATLPQESMSGFGVSDVRLSADGKRAAIMDVSGVVTMWDIEAWKTIVILDPRPTLDYYGIEQDGERLDINADGTQVLSTLFDQLILWDVDSGEIVQTVSLSDYGPVAALDWSTDETRVFLAFRPTAPPVVLDLVTGKIVQRFEFEPNPPLSQAISGVFSRDDRLLLVGYRSYGAVLWSLEDGEVINLFPTAQNGSAWSVAFSPDEQLVAVGNEASVELWQINTSGRVRSWLTFRQEPLSRANGLFFRPDRRTLLVSYDTEPEIAFYQPAMKLWRYASDALVSVTDLDGQVLAYSADAQYALITTAPITIAVQNLQTGEIGRRLVDTSCTQAVFSTDGAYALLGGGEREGLLLWNLQTGGGDILYQGVAIDSLAASPDGRYFAVAVAQAGKSELILFTQTGEQVRHLEEIDQPIKRLTFSADSQSVMAEADEYGSLITQWDVESGALREQFTFDAPSGMRTGIHIMPNMRDVLVVFEPFSQDSQAIMDARTGEVRVLLRNSQNVFELQPDTTGTRILGTICTQMGVFSCDEYALRVWDATTGAELQTHPIFDISLDLAWSADGNYALLANESGVLQRWRFESPEEVMIRLEQEERLRPFTREECAVYRLTCAD